jgi:hypothetical protein
VLYPLQALSWPSWNNGATAPLTVSLFFAGRITDFAGAFVQGTYSGTDRAFSLDNTDIRFTTPTPLSFDSMELRVGASINNGPTIQGPI